MKKVNFMASVEEGFDIDEVAKALEEKGAKINSTLKITGIILGQAPEPLDDLKILGIKHIEASGTVKKLKK